MWKNFNSKNTASLTKKYHAKLGHPLYIIEKIQVIRLNFLDWIRFEFGVLLIMHKRGIESDFLALRSGGPFLVHPLCS